MTIKTKIVKTHHLEVYDNVAAGTTDDWNPGDSWLIQDDITLIGFTIETDMNLGTTPALTEGRGYVAAELSRAAKAQFHAVLGKCVSQFMWVTEIVVAAQLGNLTGEGQQNLVVMFPAGNGIDLEDGDYLYLNGAAVANILASGNMEVAASITIYYTER